MNPLLIGPIFELFKKGLDAVWPDPATKADAQLKLLVQLQSADQAELNAAIAQLQQQAAVVLAEAAGESWLQRNWRPILMLVVVAIVANNYLVAPYLRAMFGAAAMPTLDLPERLWDLMTLGVGGYVAGRSVEKSIKNWRTPTDGGAP